MILAGSVVASLGIGWLRRGSLRGLARVPLRWGALAVLAFAIQALFIYQATPHQVVAGTWGWSEVLFLGSHALLLAVAWTNRRLDGMVWIGLGLLLNLAVMMANRGWMPISPQALVQAGHAHLAPSLEPGTRVLSSKNIVLSYAETRLWFLSDVFVLASPFPIPSVFSIGDALVAWGVLILIQGAMLSADASIPFRPVT